ncbi:hypothetical protein [Bradyrhizobium sp. LA2.1]|uniref:hypothetical protein n=1 Tax=Bradyrhizobium sp. LA2.1 TaxID=3156376 RepID=UPI0033930344
MTAFKGTYADWKLIKSRSVVQIIFEVPLHEADAAYEVLGGMPAPATERWFGIAALAPKPAQPQPVVDKPLAGAKRDWRDMAPAQQAGIRCDEPAFVAFLKEERPDDWHEATDAAECVRMICGVSSRSELTTNHAARVIWHQLDTQYGAWKALEHA